MIVILVVKLVQGNLTPHVYLVLMDIIFMKVNVKCIAPQVHTEIIL